MESVATLLPQAQANLATTTLSNEQPLSQIVSKKAGVGSDVAACVAESVAGNTIAAMFRNNTARLTIALLAELQGCAKEYTGCPKTDQMTFDECVEFLVNHFGFLNIAEIRIAFRLAATGQFDGVGLEAYFGTFTVGMLGKVMTAYREYRDESVKQARRVESESAALDSGEARKRQHDMEAWEVRRMEVLLMLHEPTVEHCTAYDYEFLTRRGEIVLTEEEKKAMFQRRYQLVVREMYRDMEDATPYRKREMLNEIEQGKQGKYSEAFKNKMVVAGRRLAVLDWIEKKKSISVHQ